MYRIIKRSDYQNSTVLYLLIHKSMFIKLNCKIYKNNRSFISHIYYTVSFKQINNVTLIFFFCKNFKHRTGLSIYEITKFDL